MTVWVHIVDGEPVEARMNKDVEEEELFNRRVEELLKDKDWVAKTVNDFYSCCDLYKRMKTEKGRQQIEEDIREQAKSEAEDWLDDRDCEWFEVEVTE